MHHATPSVFLLKNIQLLFDNAGGVIDFYIITSLEEIAVV